MVSQAIKIKAKSAAQEMSSPNTAPNSKAVRNILRGGVQPKLKIGAVNDPAEIEADRVADQVMRMPAPIAAVAPPAVPSPPGDGTAGGYGGTPLSIRRKCATCDDDKVQRKEVKPSHPLIRRRSFGGDGGGGLASAEADTAIKSLGSGSPLPASERSFFEPRFGHDLSGVRIHTSGIADTASRAINARAFSLGNNIAFARGEYQPGTQSGRTLMAHEITHTMQDDGRADQHIRRTINPCYGKIEVMAGTISIPEVAVSHLYIVYTDSSGNMTGLRGGPGPASAGSDYGNIVTQTGPYATGFVDYDLTSPSLTVYEGDDACNKYATMLNHLTAIPTFNIPYSPYQGPNSNSVVASLLNVAGLPIRKPNVNAPGFDQELLATGPSDLSVMGDRRHRLFVAFNSRDDFTAALGYRIDLFETSGFSFPLTLGAEFSPDAGANRLLFNAGLGFEMPLIHIPTSTRVPTSLGLAGGMHAGFEEDLMTGDLDSVLGAYFRASIGFDINRVRLSPFYQLDYLNGVQHNAGIQAGYTF